jgi:hypothetical protein
LALSKVIAKKRLFACFLSVHVPKCLLDKFSAWLRHAPRRYALRWRDGESQRIG